MLVLDPVLLSCFNDALPLLFEDFILLYDAGNLCLKLILERSSILHPHQLQLILQPIVLQLLIFELPL